MQKRSLVTVVLLLLFTFGIYALIWNYKFQQELKEKTGEGFSGGMHLLMMFITFGIYAIYWQYAAGKRLAKLGASDNSILYLVLVLLGVGGIANPLLMQNQANNL
ncbi:MAG TPA: DUF4234 domain-containing protein [Acholeplasmataceae bacterium]|jgi:FlaA1/EpsC-like NDP-sugar epimerase|nr:DUF4234 domain-containing protein [Acholeplasmataceae bacterium]